MDLIVDKLNYIWPFLAVITPVVFFHELGHYLVARINGVRVEVFAVGFGPELIGIDDRRGTRWKICALPLGGYVKFYGDADVASTGPEGDGPPPANSFYAKNVGQRSAIAVAGPFANLLLAAVIFAVFFLVVGQRYTPVEIGVVRAGSPAAVAGIRPGDRLVELNGSPVERFEELEFALLQNLGEPIALAVERGGARLAFAVEPEIVEVLDAFDRPQQVGDIGVRPFTAAAISQVVGGSPAERGGLQPGDSILRIGDTEIASFEDLRTVVERNAGVPLAFVVARDGREETLTVTPNDANGTGRIGVYPEEPSAIRELGLRRIDLGRCRADLRPGCRQPPCDRPDDRRHPLHRAAERPGRHRRHVAGRDRVRRCRASSEFAALISIALGLINLFPIPPLDGGHLLYNAVEAAFRRPLAARFQQIGTTVGFMLVVALMVWVTAKDIIGLTS